MGAGVYANLAAALGQLRYGQVKVQPAADEVGFYDAAFREVYQPLYATLRPLHHAIGRLV